MINEAFKLTIRPGTIAIGERGRASIFCIIDFDGKRLSVSGAEGPSRDGNCAGSCGQIVMHLKEPGALDTFKPAEGWTLDMFRQFLDTWDKWHLNDMRTYDSEMEAAGWAEQARREILVYEFTTTTETYKAKKAAEAAAIEALKAGATFTPTAAQARVAALSHALKLHRYPEEGEPEAPDGYQRATHWEKHCAGKVKAPERKTLGSVYPKDHPDGLLGRKLREDGPGYGAAWFTQEIPADVLQFLAGLPPSDRPYPWRD